MITKRWVLGRLLPLLGSALLCFLCGCGGGGGSAAPAASAVTPYSVVGKVTANGAALGQVTLTLAGGGTAFSDSQGNYAFSHLANGSYTVTPSAAGYTFTPASLTVTVADNSVQADFTAQPITTYGISGTVTSGNGGGLAGVTVTVANQGTGTTTSAVTDGTGSYTASGLVNGTYTVSASTPDGSTLTPATRTVVVQDSGASADFSAAAVSTYAIRGKVALSNGTGVANVSLVLTSGTGASYTTVSDISGNYSFTGIPDGYYTLKPSLAGYVFVPDPLLPHVNGADATGMNITAASSNTGTVTVTVNL